MDGWADSSGRMTLLWPHTAACLSVTLYLPASSAKYFRRGEGREKFIKKSDYQKIKTKTNVLEERLKLQSGFYKAS